MRDQRRQFTDRRSMFFVTFLSDEEAEELKPPREASAEVWVPMDRNLHSKLSEDERREDWIRSDIR